MIRGSILSYYVSSFLSFFLGNDDRAKKRKISILRKFSTLRVNPLRFKVFFPAVQFSRWRRGKVENFIREEFLADRISSQDARLARRALFNGLARGEVNAQGRKGTEKF